VVRANDCGYGSIAANRFSRAYERRISNRGPRDQRFRERAKKTASDYSGSRCASSGNRVIRFAGARGIVGRKSGKFRICRSRDGRQRLWQLDQTKAMDRPPKEARPLSRAYEVVRDIDAVVSEVQHRNHTDQAALFGWATGAMWCGMYASQHPEAVSHLILLNGLYGGSTEHLLLGHGSSSEDHLHPGRFDEKAVGAYSFADARSLMSRWDSSIPDEDKSLWRDPAVAQAYQDAALASDPTSTSRSPASLRAPNGGLEDSFYQAIGRALYDGSSIIGSVLIVRSGNDFWSRPEDAETLATHFGSCKTGQRSNVAARHPFCSPGSSRKRAVGIDRRREDFSLQMRSNSGRTLSWIGNKVRAFLSP
jgi:pimeloyl-ACP methyl ester carboxylesterase